MAANTDDGSAGGGPQHEPGPEEDGLNDQYVDLAQLVGRRLAEVANDLVEAVRTRPAAAAVIIGSGLGAAIGLSLARRPRSAADTLTETIGRRAPSQKNLSAAGRMGGKQLRRAASLGELIALAAKLFENPIVRGFVIQAVTKQVTRRLK